MANATAAQRGDPSNERAKARTFHHSTYSPQRIAAERAERGLGVSVCLPARECAQTVGAIVGALDPLREAGALDTIVVVDAASQDGTAERAAGAGATVWQEAELMPQMGPVLGKGDAMWRALSSLDGELVCFLDADSEHFSAHFATGLLGPLVCEPDVSFVKAFYRRPLASDAANGRSAATRQAARGGRSAATGQAAPGGRSAATGQAAPGGRSAATGQAADTDATPNGSDGQEGGRVNHLTARPALAIFYPALAHIRQPLAGEVAARRELLERLPFATGYGVEIAMLIDVWREVGLEQIAQVDLEEHHNRHQPLSALAPMALTVLATIARRLEQDGRLAGDPDALVAEKRDRVGAAPHHLGPHDDARPAPVRDDLAPRGDAPLERPPLASLSRRSTVSGPGDGA